MNNFTDLGVLFAFTEKLSQRSITQATAVQRLVIKPLLEEKSVMFRSATGTGKTFAYLIPALQRALAMYASEGRQCVMDPAVLICAPTLELCSQIKKEADFLLDGKHNVALLVGSTDMSRQIDTLKKNKPLIVVGNPGRLLLLAKMGKLKCNNLRFLVLDEADRLCAKESLDEMKALVNIIANKFAAKSHSPDPSQSCTVAACSATVSAKTREMLRPLLDNAELLETDEHEVLRDRIKHWAIFSESRQKAQVLVSFIAAAKPQKVLVFTGRTYDAGKIVAVLKGRSLHGRRIASAGLYGGMGKKERKTAIDGFRSGKVTVLVSSDLAARGLDIPDISHVIALDTSESKEAYIHRAGRTGRAGKSGIMVSIGDEIEMHRLAALEKKLGIVVYPKELYNGKIRAPVTQDDAM